MVVLPEPKLEVSGDVKTFPGQSVSFHVTGGYTYTWNPASFLSCVNCDEPVASPEESTKYCVSSAIGECFSESCINVTVACEKSHDLSVPNAFTPNGDNRNDDFCLQGWDECVTDFNVMVFDRWGEKVFETENVSTYWDGTYKNKPLNSAVFVYYINATFISGETVSKKGNISLIK